MGWWLIRLMTIFGLARVRLQDLKLKPASMSQ
jgi:hypothetical protein